MRSGVVDINAFRAARPPRPLPDDGGRLDGSCRARRPATVTARTLAHRARMLHHLSGTVNPTNRERLL